MVALLTPRSLATDGFVPSFASLPAAKQAPLRSVRPQLRLIQGGAGESRSVPVGSIVAVVLVCLAMATVIGIRISQVPAGAQSPASAQSAVASAEVVSVLGLEGEGSVTVELGQNMWDVARSISSSTDIAAVVAVLAERNGGVNVAVGQVVVVPANLLG